MVNNLVTFILRSVFFAWSLNYLFGIFVRKSDNNTIPTKIFLV
jgi:hypothetical protein